MMMGGALVGGFIYLWGFWQKFRFPIQIPVMIQRGDKGIVWDLTERGKISTSGGIRSIRLKKAKYDIKPPNYKFVSVNKKGKPVYPVFNYGTGKYGTATIKMKEINVADDLDTNWIMQQLRLNAIRFMPKESWGQLLIKYVAPIAFLASMIFFWIYFGGKLEIMANSLSGAATQIALAMEKFAAAPPPPIVG